tara:strand:- start:189 stop:488 length:300 start_codon:yes stop_codon:yes gene_type:complete
MFVVFNVCPSKQFIDVICLKVGNGCDVELCKVTCMSHVCKYQIEQDWGQCVTDWRAAYSVSQTVHASTLESLFMNVCFIHLASNIENAGHVFKKNGVMD